MDADAATSRLEDLQRDLIEFTENRLQAIDRLSAELNASLEDLRRLLEKKGRNSESRRTVDPATRPKPATLKIGSEEYEVTDEFRQAALQVADELDLDELDAAELCVEVGTSPGIAGDLTLPYRALLRFHDRRCIVLDCVRLLLLQSDDMDAGDELGAGFQEIVRSVVRGPVGKPDAASTYWRKCMDGFAELELFLRKISDHRQVALMTGTNLDPDMDEALKAQRTLLTRQHEAMAVIMSYVIRGGHTAPQDFQSFIVKAAAYEGPGDFTIHYLPVLISGSAYFGSDEATTFEAAKDLNRMFTASQVQWKKASFKAAATAIWLAEYSSRFADPTNNQILRVADRQKEEEERANLFVTSVRQRAFHFILAACAFIKPEMWHNPAKVGLLRFLSDDTPRVSADTKPILPEFVKLTVDTLQNLCMSIVTNLPDVVRRLRAEEDDQRRAFFSGPPELNAQLNNDLDRLLVIMSYAYQDEPEAAHDFWSDKESPLYGFLRWASQRLPTPRVASFCELLGAIASDEKSANHAHRFLLEDPGMATGRTIKTHSVSWDQIFSELDLYASSVKNKPATVQHVPASDGSLPESNYIEPETFIMLEVYLRLASHMCRTSPEARNWILREQNFHLGETLFQLASTGNNPQLHACCFDLLSALLTDKVPEVSDGIWVILDTWTCGVHPGPNVSAASNQTVRPSQAERSYLQSYASNIETATSLVNLLHALVSPNHGLSENMNDCLPFPENLGAPTRHPGIEAYVDFVLGMAFKMTTLPAMTEDDQLAIDVLRYCCLRFIGACLLSFNEDLVALANISAVGIDAAMEASSLKQYALLHPFARVMDWMLNNSVILAVFGAANQDVDSLNEENPLSPRVQAALGSVTAMNLAMKLQATYFDIVRPLIQNEQVGKAAVANVAFASYDDVLLGQLDVVAEIASFTTSTCTELALESLGLLQKLCSSRRLGEASCLGEGGSVRLGSRMVSKLLNRRDAIASQARLYFLVTERDLENGEQPLKLVKARALLEVLNSSLDTAGGRPSVAHVLLGFSPQARAVTVEPDSLFGHAESLFHSIATYAAVSTYTLCDSNMSWLLAIKRGCLEVVVRLANSPLTSSIVLPELRSMDFLVAASDYTSLSLTSPLWDYRMLQDPDFLLGSSALATEEFMRTREQYLRYAAIELRTVRDDKAYSVQENIINALSGGVRLPSGEEIFTSSIFDLFDFFDLEIVPDSHRGVLRIMTDVDLSPCLKLSSDSLATYDIPMAQQLLTFRKRELASAGVIKDASDEQQVDEEAREVLASLVMDNQWRAIQLSRFSALEAWADLLSLMVTTEGVEEEKLTMNALHGLQVVLPRFEKALSENMDCAPLLAKLLLTLVPALIMPRSANAKQSANLAQERLLAAFRVCLKAITDSDSGPDLRDVCYRTACGIVTSVPLVVVNGKSSPSPNAKQLLHLVQGSGNRLINIITEDAFSGRGATRVSSLLFLDGLISLFQAGNMTSSLLTALKQLNFMPVLIDQSVGSIASSFSSTDDRLTTAVAYFHTALSLLLRICRTAEGTQIVLGSGFFVAVEESKLFSTDPDIGLDIDNPVALKEFYRLLSAVLRLMTAVVVTRGPNNASILPQAKNFLQHNRFSMQAVFKRTSAVQKTAGPPESEAFQVADDFSKLILATGFLDDDEPVSARGAAMDRFT